MFRQYVEVRAKIQYDREMQGITRGHLAGRNPRYISKRIRVMGGELFLLENIALKRTSFVRTEIKRLYVPPSTAKA